MPRATINLNPARPDSPVYGVDALAMVPVFRDREEYQKATGEQAPPFNPDKPVKRWFYTHLPGGALVDSGVVHQLQTYDVKPEVPVLRQFSVPGSDVGTVNLPGKYVYPARVVNPSGAFYMLNGEKQYINPAGLATEEEAKALLQELVATGRRADTAEAFQLERVGIFAIGYDSGEARRLFQISIEGERYNVGAVLADKHAEGVGAPGKWSEAGKPVDWLPEPVVERKGTAGEFPVPMRALENGESWQRIPFGVQIVNALTPEGASELNEKNLADNVAATRRGVEKLMSFFGVS